MSASAFDYNLKIENKKVCDILALRPLFSGQGKNRSGCIQACSHHSKARGKSHCENNIWELIFGPHYTFRDYDIVLELKRGRSNWLVFPSRNAVPAVLASWEYHGGLLSVCVRAILSTNIGCGFVKRYLTSKETMQLPHYTPSEPLKLHLWFSAMLDLTTLGC